ncbi:MAG: amidase [Actinomycetota bacterium]|nr:amidase [Actinomycetota bacterium]
MATFITAMSEPGEGPTLAVKDLIDVRGVPTTAGCAALADTATPAAADAACLAGARAAGARLVGKTNLHELAFGSSGVNPWFGTPVNPLDGQRVPGGSSSGSAVAVATGAAEVGYGTDTGGSVRIPAACCGVAGLKTTHGRVPVDGVWPLAQSLDSVGPLARDIAGLELGMRLLEPGFAPLPPATRPVVGRFRGLGADPVLEAAVDEALAAAGIEVVEVRLPGWTAAHRAARRVIVVEAWANDGRLLASAPERVGADVAARLRAGQDFPAERVAADERTRADWRAELAVVFDRVQAIALPTMTAFPPTLDDVAAHELIAATAAVNLGGHPALAMPVPSAGPLPGSLQLVGPAYGEEGLLALGRLVELAVG